ncbi:TniB family NTP-binding protein [Nostoc sp. ChiSLP03a]|uniref:TniB family NTP-binding protein n=1 Tax=Nostoc sp. ChiSLP03a TaxID=3075380 RepID=UPI002AD4EBCF|nr:TniB family NTP-binding protein [Nostoc sp. ChiSLP03a]MDZ8211355.1 TniB family NTP-binding protein [Nostoc sp. ChiSLP03a]
MTSKQAQEIAQQLGDIPKNDANLQAEIQRLNRKSFVPLEQVQILHEWLESKRQARQCCRIIGESRTGKTMACNAYRLRHKPIQQMGKPPIVPVGYIQADPDCSSKDLFRLIIEHLKYQMTKGTVAEIRERTRRVLKGCGVETLIIDEADRLKPNTFRDVRDIGEELEISVVLVGTDRLDAVIKRDEQVYNRFRACHRFGKFSGEEFKRTVEIWEKKVLQLPVASNLSSKTMLKNLGEATGGYIGLLDMILRESAIRALKKGLKKVDLATLNEVAAEYK